MCRLQNASLIIRQTNRNEERILNEELIKIALMETRLYTDACILDVNLNLNMLFELNMASSQLIAIDVNVFATFNCLEKLNLHWNKITQIKANTFHGLKKLKILNLHGNQISETNVNTFQGYI